MKSLNKKQIRKYIKDRKKEMSESQIKEYSYIIQEKLFSLEEYMNSDNIYIYINYNQEVITSEIIKRSLALGKKIYVPKVYEDVMKFHQITSLDEDLAPGVLGILEPTNSLIDQTRDGLLIMPGLAFDRQFKRVGYGGGYYDKYLALPNSHTKIALAYEFQILDSIETDEFDQKVDIIITQNNILRI